MTVARFLESWQSGTGGRHVSPEWHELRTARLRKYALSPLGDVPLAGLTPAHVWELQRVTLAAGVTNKTVNDVVVALLALVRDAVLEGACPASVRAELLAGVRPLRADPDPRYAPWTAWERDTILAHVRDHHAHAAPLVAFLFDTGMRPGEALALRWRDVSRSRRWCRIVASRRPDGSLTPCKTSRSRRELRLARAAVAAIGGLERAAPAAFVFLGPRGAPVNLRNFANRTWRTVMRELAGQVADRPLYAARHTFASLQVSTGNMTLQQVAAYIGDDPVTASRRYAHFLPDYQALDIDAGLDFNHDQAPPGAGLQMIDGGRT